MDNLKLSSGEEKVYTAMWSKVTGGDDTLDAGDAVGILTESKLDESILHEIWEHSDLDGEGYLTIEGFKIAMKLVAVVQAGFAAELKFLDKTTPLADLGKLTNEYKHLADKSESASKGSKDIGDGWAITKEEKMRYDESFDQLGPTADDIITGKKARKVLLKTGLPQDVLGKIWELADIDSDGNLDRDEFAVAMSLIRTCMSGKSAPDKLPANLIPPSKRGADQGSRKTATPTSSPPPATTTKEPPTVSEKKAEPKLAPKKEEVDAVSRKTTTAVGDDNDWIVTAKELKTYDDFFNTADKDKDGLVSGGDIMKIFLTSKLPKDVLAHVWNLVDIDDSGEINSEQFALAMHFIAQKVKGKDVPKKLSPNMVPPSLRSRIDGGSNSRGTTPVPGGSDSSSELREAKKTNASLKAEIEATNAELEAESGDLTTMQAEIKKLRAEEKKLRAELKASKDKLQEVVAQKRKAKADKKKIQGKISTLSASQAKVTAGLKSAGWDPSDTAESSANGGGDEMETYGHSMADYFGQS